MDYKKNGFRPEAVVNYLALLGWSSGDDKEIMSANELIERFTLERINSSNAIFDQTKLEWMNQQYIMKIPPAEFSEVLKPFIIKAGLLSRQDINRCPDWFVSVCNLMQPRLKVLCDIDKQGRYFFKDDFVYDQTVLEKFLTKETLTIMKKFISVLNKIEPFEAEKLEKELRDFGASQGLKVKQWIHPLRVFITGTSAGPPFFNTLELIGKTRCINRIEKILQQVQESK